MKKTVRGDLLLLLCGVLIWPLVKLLQKIEKQSAV